MPLVEFRAVVDSSESLSDVLRKMGLRIKGGNNKTVKNRCLADGIDYDRLIEGGKRHIGTALRNRMPPLETVLTSECDYSRKSLRKRLVSVGLLENNCGRCGIGTEWNGEPLSLTLDHINGVSNDNRISNLRLLCPNCHSQTITFSGRNNLSRVGSGSQPGFEPG